MAILAVGCAAPATPPPPASTTPPATTPTTDTGRSTSTGTVSATGDWVGSCTSEDGFDAGTVYPLEANLVDTAGDVAGTFGPPGTTGLVPRPGTPTSRGRVEQARPSGSSMRPIYGTRTGSLVVLSYCENSYAGSGYQCGTDFSGEIAGDTLEGDRPGVGDTSRASPRYWGREHCVLSR